MIPRTHQHATTSSGRNSATAAVLDLIGLLRPDWMTDAACRNTDPNFWLPAEHRHHRVDWEKRRRICQDCPVKRECLEWATRHGEQTGMWGGLTPDERPKTGARPAGYPHATATGYRQGCRCGQCRQAHTEYRRRERARNNPPGAST